jgi:hypothetical protein
MAEQAHSTLQPLSPPASDPQKDASWKEWQDKNPKSTAPSADHGPAGATEKNLDTTSSAEEKMESLWAFVDKTGVGVLTTLSKDGGMLGRAMGNLKIEKEGRGAVWFVNTSRCRRYTGPYVDFLEPRAIDSRRRIATRPRSNT